jgi:hypothetical protein
MWHDNRPFSRYRAYKQITTASNVFRIYVADSLQFVASGPASVRESGENFCLRKIILSGMYVRII